MAISHLHHINFIVHDLEEAVQRYQQNLGLSEFIFDPLPKRGVKTARVMLGEVWLVLVQPTNPNSEPGKYLQQHGEGFFLLSLATNDLDDTIGRLGLDLDKRRGLENWQVADLPKEMFFGAQLQLTEELPTEPTS